MGESTILELEPGASETVGALTVTFAGSAPVQYGSRPPAGCILLDFTVDGETERETLMERDWGEPQEILGFRYRVLNAPELQPKVAKVEILGAVH